MVPKQVGNYWYGLLANVLVYVFISEFSIYYVTIKQKAPINVKNHAEELLEYYNTSAK